MKVKEYKVKVRQFLTRSKDNPVPMRIMFGWIEKETQKGVYVHLQGKAEPSDVCMKCGKVLTHPVSLLYGVGPECGGHYHNSPMPKDALEAWFEEIKKNMNDVTWEGWLPRFHIEMEETGKEIEAEEPKTDEPKAEEKKADEPKVEEPKKPVVEAPVDEKLVDELLAELKG
jgi:predicted  nucleic acid-binding Zn-ribbon protein